MDFHRKQTFNVQTAEIFLNLVKYNIFIDTASIFALLPGGKGTSFTRNLIWHTMGKALGDRVLGCGLGIALISGRVSVKDYIGDCLQSIQMFLLHQMDWFETARPSGVKLHKLSCLVLSSAGTIYTLAISKLYVFLESLKIFDLALLLLGAVLIVFGLRHGLRVAYSFAIVVTSPISFMAMIAESAAKLHLTLVRNLWQSMRGNICSSFLQSSYCHDCDMDASPYELAISCLLFMPVILTLPTMLWYCYFTYILWKFVYFSLSLSLKALL